MSEIKLKKIKTASFYCSGECRSYIYLFDTNTSGKVVIFNDNVYCVSCSKLLIDSLYKDLINISLELVSESHFKPSKDLLFKMEPGDLLE